VLAHVLKGEKLSELFVDCVFKPGHCGEISPNLAATGAWHSSVRLKNGIKSLPTRRRSRSSGNRTYRNAAIACRVKKVICFEIDREYLQVVEDELLERGVTFDSQPA
jgi:hypothetical protein